MTWLALPRGVVADPQGIAEGISAKHSSWHMQEIRASKHDGTLCNQELKSGGCEPQGSTYNMGGKLQAQIRTQVQHVPQFTRIIKTIRPTCVRLGPHLDDDTAPDAAHGRTPAAHLQHKTHLFPTK